MAPVEHKTFNSQFAIVDNSSARSCWEREGETGDLTCIGAELDRPKDETDPVVRLAAFQGSKRFTESKLSQHCL